MGRYLFALSVVVSCVRKTRVDTKEKQFTDWFTDEKAI